MVGLEKSEVKVESEMGSVISKIPEPFCFRCSLPGYPKADLNALLEDTEGMVDMCLSHSLSEIKFP